MGDARYGRSALNFSRRFAVQRGIQLARNTANLEGNNIVENVPFSVSIYAVAIVGLRPIHSARAMHLVNCLVYCNVNKRIRWVWMGP